jgi:uncharacterized membrane protein/1-acyl-sn-glycerol-3-phosphate acyltransferase
MRVVKFLFVCHLAILILALGGLLIVLPHPELWGVNPLGLNFFTFILRSAGSLLILFGAATMLLFGLLCVGLRKTLIFFAISTLISLSVEVLNIGTSFPFGAYSSNIFPGFKVGGLIPYAIPLSWFYMGFTSYLLASKLTSQLRLLRQTLWSLILGTYFLATWGLALNLVMTSERIPVWHEYGSYYGLPVSNLVGWTVNCVIFLSVSRLLWRGNLNTHYLAIWVPFGVYTANTGFVMGLNLGLGLWFPLALSMLLVLLPESLVLIPSEETRISRVGPGRTALSQLIWLVMRAGSKVFARRKVEMHVEGLKHIPRSGPVLIAARHFHWFYDGYVLLRTIPRRLHTIVALDWVQSRGLRLTIELACSLADWLVVLRRERFQEHEKDERWAYTPIEARQYLRQMTLGAIRLLRSGEILVMFPEGYPNIDPHPTPKPDLDAFLPFRPGFVKMAEMAEKDGLTQVAIVPVGLSYMREQGKRWHTTVRFGPALFRSDFANSEQLLQAVEEHVQVLSSAVPPRLS